MRALPLLYNPHRFVENNGVYHIFIFIKVITRISATDKDEVSPDVKFTYFLTSEDSNFTLTDNHGVFLWNTCNENRSLIGDKNFKIVCQLTEITMKQI